MHILTKIFVVLVSLLAVMLVPLVVTYVHNEESFRAKFDQADAEKITARSSLEAAKANFTAVLARKDNEITDRVRTIGELRSLLTQKEREVQEKDALLARASEMDADIMAQLSRLASATDSGQKLTESLVSEVRQLRQEGLMAERQKVELDEALRDAQAQLEVSTRARRALEEEVQRLKDETASLIDRVSRYVAAVGELDSRRATVAAGAMVDVDLDCRIIRVRREADRTLAEIDAGQRDGVKVGWVVPIGRGDFVANLRILTVDVNTATGVVEMENATTRGRVEVGDRVLFRTGR